MPQILPNRTCTYAYALSTTANDAHAVLLPAACGVLTIKPTTNASRFSYSDTDDSAMAASDYPLAGDVAVEVAIPRGGLVDKRGAIQFSIDSVVGLAGEFLWFKLGSTEYCVEFDGVGVVHINVAVGDAPTTAASLATAINSASIGAKAARNQADTSKCDLITTADSAVSFRTSAPTLVSAELWQPGKRSVLYIGSATHSTVIRLAAEPR